MMFHVIWFEGWTENVHTFESREAAAQFIDDTGLDPDEFDIIDD